MRLRHGATASVSAALTVPGAHLWQGVTDPYLYRFSAEVLAADGSVLDRLVQPYGIREMRIDPQRGFLLNGTPYAVRGVGYHQDREDSAGRSPPPRSRRMSKRCGNGCDEHPADALSTWPADPTISLTATGWCCGTKSRWSRLGR